jgi:PEP-CTERM motif
MSRKHIALMALLGAVGMAAAYAGPAKADLIYTLNIDGCGSGCGGNIDYGTVTLHQVDVDTVSVTVNLSSGIEFVATGAGDSLVFNVDKAVTLSNITTGFAQDPSNPVHVGFFGSFGIGVDCTTGCGNGGSNPNPGPLFFDSADGGGLSVTDFVANKDGFFFASDIANTNLAGAPTGNVGSNGPTCTGDCGGPSGSGEDVPEPQTMAMFGTALLGLAVLRRRKR